MPLIYAITPFSLFSRNRIAIIRIAREGCKPIYEFCELRRREAHRRGMPSTMKILIAYDGSAGADAALEDLGRAGLPDEAQVVVLAVADVWMPPPLLASEGGVEATFDEHVAAARARACAIAQQAVEEARALAVRASETIQALFPTWEVHAEACADSPAWGVIKKADEWEPDIVVVGSHDRSTLGRFLLGSVSHRVLTEARCTVRVARGHLAERTAPVRLVIGVDGSPGAEAAVGAVAQRLWRPGSEARIIVVLDRTLATTLGWQDTKGEEAQVREIVERAAEKVRAAGLVVSSIVKEGDPKRALVAEAEQWGADCIFVGARGLRRLERFLLGSVSAAVAARAHCSVEVVRSRPLAEKAERRAA
jgi:nucleotide-binding universal stress UspA family protein